MFDISSRDSSAAGSLILLAITIVVIIWLVVLGLIGWLVFRMLRKHLGAPQAAGARPARLFDAPPTSSWLDTYDLWLAKLEKVTRIDFTRTPRRLMVGALIISVGTGLVIGVFVLLLTSLSTEVSLGSPMAIGAIVGGMTGRKLSQPVGGWFDFTLGQGQKHDAPSHERGFVLGEEVRGD